MYRNLWYDFKHGAIWMSTWDQNGNRTEECEPFKPYLYIAQSGCHDGVSIYGDQLRKIEFSNTSKRKDYCAANKKTFYCLPPIQQYLIDKFRGNEQEEDFSKYPLSIYFLDIETFSPNGFPNPLLAEDEITVITVYSVLEKQYHVFCTGVDYYTQERDVVTHFFPSEHEMLRGFIRWWRKDFPDIVSGWYSNGFDIPYICNRIDKVYGEKFACSRLSPVGKVRMQENAKRRYGAEERIYDQFWTIEGVTHIDMQAAYFKFAPKKLESYSLNSVCAYENVGQKLEYEGSLADFWLSHPQEFIDYNVQDVRLLVKLEEKLKYMQLCRHNAYSALTSIGDSLGTIPIVTGLVALEALGKNRIISTFDNSDAVVSFEGGFVSKPVAGFAKSIVSVDANSLYPSVIRTLNISNETKIGKYYMVAEDKVVLVLVNGKKIETTKAKFIEWARKNDIALSPNGVMFSQKAEGVLPSLIKRLYNGRKTVKGQMLELERVIESRESKGEHGPEIEALKKKAEYLNIRQWLLKIQLNSIYGASAEKHYALFDMDLSESVTAMGRETIKKTALILNDIASKMIGEETDVQLYGDTDSRYFTIEPILKKMGEQFTSSDGTINPVVNDIVEKIVDETNEAIVDWHRKKFNCLHSAVGFKREALADSGLFLAPKMYALHILNDEGIPCNKVAFHGVAVVRSSTPSALKPMIKDMMETMIKTANRAKVIEKAQKYWQEFQNMPLYDKAVSIGLNGLSEYKAKCSVKDGELVVASGTPRQVKCALQYNFWIKKFNLDTKYESLKEGDKMQIIYVLNNKFGVNSLAFNRKIPTEWEDIFKIDDATMFDKVVWSSIQKCFDVVGWHPFTPSKGDTVDLLTIFG